MITQQMAAIHTQFEARVKATSDNHNQQIQIMLGQFQNEGGAQPGSETTHNKEKLDSKFFTEADKFDGEWKDSGFTFNLAGLSSSHDPFDLLNLPAIWTAPCPSRSRCS